MRYQHNWFCTCLQYRPAAVVCSYDRYVQNWISLAYQKQFSCENFFEMIMYLSKLNGDKSLLCLHMFRRACSTYCEVSTQVQSTMNPQRHLSKVKSSILLHIIGYSPRFVNFPINFNHNWWEFRDCLPLGDDRSQSHYATKNQYSKQNLWEFSI